MASLPSGGGAVPAGRTSQIHGVGAAERARPRGDHGDRNLADGGLVDAGDERRLADRRVSRHARPDEEHRLLGLTQHLFAHAAEEAGGERVLGRRRQHQQGAGTFGHVVGDRLGRIVAANDGAGLFRPAVGFRPPVQLEGVDVGGDVRRRDRQQLDRHVAELGQRSHHR